MDLLRWILLIVGLLIVAGVYWWSRRSEREQERMFARTEPGLGHHDEESDPLFAPVGRRPVTAGAAEDEPDLEAVHRELSSLQELLQSDAADDREGRRPVFSAVQAEPAEPLPEIRAEPRKAATPAEEKLVVLYLVAPARQVFPGEAVTAALEETGLQYGEMHIYHRYVDGNATPVFGVANLVEPGTLEVESLAASGTPGLTLFLQMPGPLRPLQAFDLFVASAQQLAGALGGELRDQSRNSLSRQTLEHLRDDVQQYERRLYLRQA